jgi:hypothetical protein
VRLKVRWEGSRIGERRPPIMLAIVAHLRGRRPKRRSEVPLGHHFGCLASIPDLIMESTWRKKVTFTDSCKILTFSMSQLLQDSVGILEDAAAGGDALEEAFNTTLRHVLAEGYDKNDFFYLLKKNWKFVMLFEKIDSLAYLEAQSSPPPREHFASLLSGRAILSEVDYDLFLNTWKRLRIENMFQLFRLYLALDVTNLTCVLDFYFQKMFKQTRLYASHFFTISSLALAAALLNSSDPEKPERTSLGIPLRH